MTTKLINIIFYTRCRRLTAVKSTTTEDVPEYLRQDRIPNEDEDLFIIQV